MGYQPVTKKNTLVLAEPNITVKSMYQSKKTTNSHFQYQDRQNTRCSRCSHPVKLLFGEIRSMRSINQLNLYVFKKTLVITM